MKNIKKKFLYFKLLSHVKNGDIRSYSNILKNGNLKVIKLSY